MEDRSVGEREIVAYIDITSHYDVARASHSLT